MNIRQYHMIVNPHSKSGKGETVWQELEKELIRRKISYDVHFTEYQGHACALARELSHAVNYSDGEEAILVLGGDGTLGEVITGLEDNYQGLLGYIPSGSGNDFARSMRFPSSPMQVLQGILASEQTIPVDAGHVLSGSVSEKNDNSMKEERRFAVSCGIGFDAAVCHQTFTDPCKPFLNKLHLGKLSYVVIGIQQIINLHPAEGELFWQEEENGQEHHRNLHRMAFLSIHNQPYEGGGFCFAPKASPSDGYLDICLIDGLSRLQLVPVLLLSLFGRHLSRKGVTWIRCVKAHLQIDRELPVHADGENMGIRRELAADIRKHAVRMIVPLE